MTDQLLLGDSTDRLREIPDESVDLILTDPPYNTGIKGSASGTRFWNFFDDALSPAATIAFERSHLHLPPSRRARRSVRISRRATWRRR
jgi:DNA modification methylase